MQSFFIHGPFDPSTEVNALPLTQSFFGLTDI